MPYLKQITGLINDHYLREGGVLSDDKFSTGQINGLAEKVFDDSDKAFPTIYDQLEHQRVGLDDTYPFVLYHRSTGNVYERLSGFGAGYNVKQMASMVMIAFAVRDRIRLSPEELEGILILDAPDMIAKSMMSDLPVDSADVLVTGSELESAIVFGEEYPGSELSVGPEDILIKIEYTIVLQYRKDCQSFCDCL